MNEYIEMVGLNKDFKGTHNEAFYKFIENSSFKIMTDKSISAITLIASLNDGIPSPYVSIDTDEISFMTPIKKLLLKIMPSYSSDVIVLSNENAVTRNRIADQYNGAVEINPFTKIASECETQKDIYRKSILNIKLALIPVCPSVIYMENPVAEKDRFKGLLSGNVVPRKDRTAAEEEAEITQFLNVTSDFSIIAMELLDGYKTLYDVIIENQLVSKDDSKLIELIDLELFRTHSLGYFHGDLHVENIMFNETKNYSSIQPGKAMIIDFGRTTNNTAKMPIPCQSFSLISKQCLEKEKIHENLAPTEPKILVDYLKDIQTINNQKLDKISDKLLYPGKDLNESIKEYAETRVYIGGGGDEIDVDYLREIVYGMLMQNDTPDTFDLVGYLDAYSETSASAKATTNINIGVEPDAIRVSGGKKRRTRKLMKRVTKKKRQTKSKRTKSIKNKNKK